MIYCINCEEQTKFVKKVRYYKTPKGLIKNYYEECINCGVEKDLPLYLGSPKCTTLFKEKHIKKHATKNNNPKSKLNWQKVNEIRDKYKNTKTSHQKLADEYGVNRSTIKQIVTYMYWKK